MAARLRGFGGSANRTGLIIGLSVGGRTRNFSTPSASARAAKVSRAEAGRVGVKPMPRKPG